MTQHTEFMNGAIVTYSEVDATFQFEGMQVDMEFHVFCGPMFMIKHSAGSEEDFYPDDTERFKPLWESFEAWQKTEKGVRVQAHADQMMGINRE